MSLQYQNKISEKIEKLGKSVTFTPFSSDVYNEDEGWTANTGTTFAATIIVYDNINNQINWISAGNLEQGDLNFVGKGTDTFNRKDTFTYNSKNYEITMVQRNPLSDNGTEYNLANVCVAKEVL